jgi:hypothetical protein
MAEGEFDRKLAELHRQALERNADPAAVAAEQLNRAKMCDLEVITKQGGQVTNEVVFIPEEQLVRGIPV